MINFVLVALIVTGQSTRREGWKLWWSEEVPLMVSISELCCSFEDVRSGIAFHFQAKQHLIIVIMLSNIY